jgi:cell division protein ZapA
MAEVQLHLGGRHYGVHCRDGEEAHIHALGRLINERMDKIRQGTPGINEVRLLLFAALLLADDLHEARHAAAVPPPPADPDPDPDPDPRVLRALEALAERLEGLAAAPADT